MSQPFLGTDARRTIGLLERVSGYLCCGKRITYHHNRAGKSGLEVSECCQSWNVRIGWPTSNLSINSLMAAESPERCLEVDDILRWLYNLYLSSQRKQSVVDRNERASSKILAGHLHPVPSLCPAPTLNHPDFTRYLVTINASLTQLLSVSWLEILPLCNGISWFRTVGG